MEEILHHLGCKKPCTLNDGINYLSTGAGFLPSTVFVVAKNFGLSACLEPGIISLVVFIFGFPCDMAKRIWKGH